MNARDQLCPCRDLYFRTPELAEEAAREATEAPAFVPVEYHLSEDPADWELSIQPYRVIRPARRSVVDAPARFWRGVRVLAKVVAVLYSLALIVASLWLCLILAR